MSEKNKEEQVDECDERLVYEEISTWSLISVFCSNTSGASQTHYLVFNTVLKHKTQVEKFFTLIFQLMDLAKFLAPIRDA